MAVLDGRVPGKIIAVMQPVGEAPLTPGDLDLDRIKRAQHAMLSDRARRRMTRMKVTA